MTLDQWQLGLLVAVLAANLAVTYWLVRVRRSTPAAVDPADGAGVDPEAGVVECPSCGAENDLGYRFCRACVSELPGAVYPTRSTTTPAGLLR